VERRSSVSRSRRRQGPQVKCPGTLGKVLRKESGSVLRGTVEELLVAQPHRPLSRNISETEAENLVDVWVCPARA
jgi:hypothetical protein